MRFLALSLCILLSACETSAVWYSAHPQKKTVQIEGTTLYVVPRDSNHFDVWGGDTGTKTSAVDMKERQIKAVEQVTGCTVKGAEYMAGTPLLQTKVKC